MKRSVYTACMLSTVLLAFALSASTEPIIYEGPIEGLVFLFYPDPLPLTLPGISANIAFVMIETDGREHIVITSLGQYNYSANLDSGMIYAWEDVTVTVDDQGNVIGIEPECEPILIDMESGSLSEHFDIEGPIPDDPLDVIVPDDVDLYFKATLMAEGEAVNYQLKIKNGDVQFIKP